MHNLTTYTLFFRESLMLHWHVGCPCSCAMLARHILPDSTILFKFVLTHYPHTTYSSVTLLECQATVASVIRSWNGWIGPAWSFVRAVSRLCKEILKLLPSRSGKDPIGARVFWVVNLGNPVIKGTRGFESLFVSSRLCWNLGYLAWTF
jgi:hypothetical protein